MKLKFALAGAALMSACSVASAAAILSYSVNGGATVSINDADPGLTGDQNVQTGVVAAAQINQGGWTTFSLVGNGIPGVGSATSPGQNLNAVAMYAGAGAGSLLVQFASDPLYLGPLNLGALLTATAPAGGTATSDISLDGGATWSPVSTSGSLFSVAPGNYSIMQRILFTAPTAGLYTGVATTNNAPEPGTIAALGIGMAALGLFGRRRARRAAGVQAA